MDDKLAQQVFEELLPSLEALDTKCAAILQFLKTKGIVTDDELAPYFEQAGNASSVRWRAARVRINHLLSATQASEKEKDKDKASSSSEASEKKSEATIVKQSTEADAGKSEKDGSAGQKNADTAQANAASNIENQRNADQKESQSAEREQKDRQPLEHGDKDAA